MTLTKEYLLVWITQQPDHAAENVWLFLSLKKEEKHMEDMDRSIWIDYSFKIHIWDLKDKVKPSREKKINFHKGND